MKTTYEKTLIDKAKKLLELAMLSRAKGYEVFVDFSPHVNSISMRCYFKGWDSKKDTCDFEMRTNLERASAANELDVMIGFLTKALKD